MHRFRPYVVTCKNVRNQKCHYGHKNVRKMSKKWVYLRVFKKSKNGFPILETGEIDFCALFEYNDLLQNRLLASYTTTFLFRVFCPFLAFFCAFFGHFIQRPSTFRFLKSEYFSRFFWKNEKSTKNIMQRMNA